jgi:hypothetical protein
MFRWVQCQLDNLRKIRTYCALDSALTTLPTGLFETYDRILYRIPDHNHEHVIRILGWLVTSEYPLNLEELAEAIAIVLDKAKLDHADLFTDPEETLELCSSLLTLQPDGKVVLAHFSVRKYLLSDRLAHPTSPLVRFALNEADFIQYITRCLLTYVFAIGTHIQGLDYEVLEESDFPLLRFTKAVSSIEQFQNLENMRPWVEAHFVSDDLGPRRMSLLKNYTESPATHEMN